MLEAPRVSEGAGAAFTGEAQLVSLGVGLGVELGVGWEQDLINRKRGCSASQLAPPRGSGPAGGGRAAGGGTSGGGARRRGGVERREGGQVRALLPGETGVSPPRAGASCLPGCVAAWRGCSLSSLTPPAPRRCCRWAPLGAPRPQSGLPPFPPWRALPCRPVRVRGVGEQAAVCSPFSSPQWPCSLVSLAAVLPNPGTDPAPQGHFPGSMLRRTHRWGCRSRGL